MQDNTHIWLNPMTSNLYLHILPNFIIIVLSQPRHRVMIRSEIVAFLSRGNALSPHVGRFRTNKLSCSVLGLESRA